jgi:predicted AlkP superfamily phosphohydrolase/phosphomutase
MYDRVIVLGIDGIDPNLMDRFIYEGDLPNFKSLSEAGSYSRLGASNPPQSPAAWSNIGTGTDSGGHGVFDFIVRNPKNYLPDLGVLKINRKNVLGIREKMFDPTSLAKFFWDYTSEAGIPSFSIRWPMTFPPGNGSGKLLAGLGVPDIKGGLGRYTYFSSAEPDKSKEGWEKIVKLDFGGGSKAKTKIVGPAVSGITGAKDSTIPMKVTRSGGERLIIEVSGKKVEAGVGEWTDWIPMEFSGGALKKVSGIGRFYVVSTEPETGIYLTPLQVNPTDPCFVISRTDDYAAEIAENIGGLYHTLGIPEDTKPVNEGVLDDDAFISMCDDIMVEREKMLTYGLDNFNEGVFSFVVDTTDRIQHMFWRFEDKEHPLYTKEGEARYGGVIRDYYKRTDKILGEIASGHVDDKTLLIVCSDHGFTSFRKGVHLNRWLVDNGLMKLKSEPDPEDLDGGALFRNVDWKKTQAYSLGFSSVYLNLKGRESSGVVDPGEAKKLKGKIAKELVSALDPETGGRVFRNVYDAKDIYAKKYIDDSPDLVVGFESGYRMSWQTAIGGTPAGLLAPNNKKWSGDHIVDPEIVPGILFSNAKIRGKAPKGMDVAPTVLKAVGIKPDESVQGKPFI